MRIRWTEPAADDLTRICDYIDARDGPAAARRVALALYQGVDSLPQFPYRGRTGRKSGTRELIYAHLPYLAVYTIRNDVIEIQRILHGAQKWP
jgi:addiction module RelE/StbE family toxin